MNNTITLAGFVGNAPIERNFESKKMAKFSIAVKQFKAGDDDEVMWVDVEGWEMMAGRVLSHVTKGREIVVHGRLALSTYIDDEGVKVIKPVVKLSGFYLCGKKPQAEPANDPTERRKINVA
jgi:single-stranded DNA-binding protein